MLGRAGRALHHCRCPLDELDRLAAQRCYPAVLRCDNGPELACAAMAGWAGDRVGLVVIPDNRGAMAISNRLTVGSATNASINIFWSLTHARVVIADWKYRYNHHRHHSALNYQPPARYAANYPHRYPKAVRTVTDIAIR